MDCDDTAKIHLIKKGHPFFFSDNPNGLSALLRDEDAHAPPRTHALGYGKTPFGVQKKRRITMTIYKGTFQPKQHYQSKMTPDELQEHLKMCRLGASRTKSKEEKRRQEETKHPKRYC